MNVREKNRIREPVIAVAIPLAVGGLSAFLTRQGMENFQLVRQPPLSPPMWLFPVVWTILYILMGIASYLVYASDASNPRKERALTVYAIQLAFNFMWSLIFFNIGLFLFAFIWLIILWVQIFVCTVLFYYITPRAGKLMIPYLLWASFAAYLNLGVYLLNR